MVYSFAENEKRASTRLKSTKEITPKRSSKFKNVDKITSKDVNFHGDISKKETLKSVNKIETLSNESFVGTNKIHPKEDNVFQLCELKLNIKRIDETNYVSMLSHSSLKNISKKSMQWSEHHQNDVPKLDEELMNNTNNEEENYEPNKRSKTSAISSTSKKSSNYVNLSASVTPKRERKSVHQFDDSKSLSTPYKTKTSSESMRWNGRSMSDISKLVAELLSDSGNEEEDYKPNKQSRKMSVSSSCSDESHSSTIESLEPTVPKRNLRGSIVTTPSKSNTVINKPEFETPKRTRKPVDRFGELVDWNEASLVNTPANNKCAQRTSSTSKKSENIVNTASFTPKRTRKSVNRLGVSVDSDNVEDTTTNRINKKRRTVSVNEDDDEIDVNVWRTPVNKHLRTSMTPTSRSGSKVRRSILQDIPENKEIDVISTPKTPRKTPKAHVKSLTASVSRRSDSGARIPCSPLEKARANLHLHAAPKHLPCRETEFKSIHSFLARKINDELTGSMYISGVPGTGKTATVKRVIDSLNSDIIMKHSFKFIEINGLRLANPHQAFSVIWKEITAETVSSSRAQALLNDYFSGKKTRELSTILLVDEVDHICNRKQDVVYNILDWPSRTGSKVIVITIANTMDLPERVLRGCVTSRMGLTRLVFKPYTFQQLQEIIMNRLIGNSSFDPDAVQLVARKVAAVSGDARRALDVCRRAIDLIKSEDESQFITINHVNQVLNSILSGVRVTAIRQCSVLEQIFLKSLRDETNRTGFDHSTIDSVYVQMKNICLLEGEELPNDQQVIMMAYRLRDSGLIFLEKKRWDIFRKVSLNVSPEDISYALDKYNI